MPGEGFHSEELTGHMWKVDPNERGSLDCFPFLMWYVNKEVYLDSSEETENLVGWAAMSS